MMKAIIFYLFVQFVAPLLLFLSGFMVKGGKRALSFVLAALCFLAPLPVICLFSPTSREIASMGLEILGMAPEIEKVVEHQKEVRRQLPEAERVFAELKKEAGTTIHKPFEQWVRENPGVLEKLEQPEINGYIAKTKAMGDSYPNRWITHKKYRLGLSFELTANGKQRIGWYHGGEECVNGMVTVLVDVLYDIEKKEVLAEETKVEINRTGMPGPEFVPERYYGPALGKDDLDFIGYKSLYFQHNQHEEK